MADDASRLSIDTTKGVAALDSLIGKIHQYNAELANIRTLSASMNKENQIASATFIATDKALNQYIVSLKETAVKLEGVALAEAKAAGKSTFVRELGVAKVTLLSVASDLDKVRTAKERLAESLKAGIPQQFAKVPGIATPAETEKFNAATNKLINLAAKTPDTLGIDRIQKLFTEVANNSKRTYTGVLEDARVAITKIIDLHGQLGAKVRQETLERNTALRSAAATTKLQDVFGPIKADTSKAEIEKITRALVAFQKVMKDSNLNLNDFKSALKAFKTGDIGKTDDVEKLRQAIFNVSRAYDTAGTAAERQQKAAQLRAERQVAAEKRIQDAIAARQIVESRISPLPLATRPISEIPRLQGVSVPLNLKPSVDEALALRNAFDKLQVAIEGSKKGADDFKAVITATDAGDTGKLSSSQIKILKLIEQTEAAYKKLGLTAIQEAQQQVTAEAKVATSLQVRQKIQESIGQINLNASRIELEKLRDAIIAVETEAKKAGADVGKVGELISGARPPIGGGPPPPPVLPPPGGEDEFEKLRKAVLKLIEAEQNLGKADREKSDKIQKDAADDIAAFKRVNDAMAAIKQLKIDFGTQSISATLPELRNYNAAITAIQTKIQASEGALKDFKKASIAFKAGDFSGLTAEQNKFVNLLATAKIEFDKLGSTIQAVSDKNQKQIDKQTQAQQNFNNAVAARQKFVNIEGLQIAPGASAKSAENLIEKLGKIQSPIESGKVSLAEFDRVLASLHSGSLDVLNEKLRAFRKTLLDARDAGIQMAQQIKDDLAKAAGAATGVRVQFFTERLFKPSFSTAASVTEIERVNKELIKLRDFFRDGTAQTKDFGAALNSVQSGNIAGLTKTQEQLRIIILGVKKAYEGTGEEARIAGEKATKAAQAQADALAKVQAKALAAANAQIQQSVRSGAAAQLAASTFKALSPTQGLFTPKIDVSTLETFKSRIASAVALVDKGKVSVADFGAVLNRVMDPRTAGLAPLTGTLGTLERRLQSAKNTVEEFGRSNTGVTNTVNTSWSTINRVFQTLVIHDAIGRLLKDFEQVVSKAAEFQISIGLLLTLSQDAPSTFDDWAKSIRSVSDELGKPIADVATAAYDALSNQVIESADDFTKFGREVGKLAIITKSELKPSIDAVSGVMNSFNLTTAETSRVNSVLFKSIDLGKIKMNELADTVGRTGPLAQSLGIQFEELAAFLTSTSRAGITVDVAMTQVGQVLNALLKPNEELSAFFKSIGADTAEEAIAMNGFVGILEKLRESTGGSTEKLAKMFPELRGLRGIVSVLRNDFKEFTGDLDKLRNEAAKGTLEATKIFDKNPGQQFRQELEKIRNFFLEQWETVVLKGLLDAGNFFGSLSTSVQGLYSIMLRLVVPTTVFVGLVTVAFRVTALLEFIKQMNVVTASMQLLAVLTGKVALTGALAFGPIVAALAAVAAGFIAIKINAAATEREIGEVFRLSGEAATSQAQKNSADYQRILDKQTADTRKAVEQQAQAYLQLPGKIRASLNQVIEAQKTANKEIVESLKNNMEIFLGALRSQISDLKSTASKLRSEAADVPDIISDTARKTGEGIFRRQREDIERSGLSETTKAIGIRNLGEQQIAILKAQAQELIKGANTLEKQQTVMQDVVALYAEARRIAEDIANIRIEQKPGGLRVGPTRKQAIDRALFEERQAPTAPGQQERIFALEQLRKTIPTEPKHDLGAQRAFSDVEKLILDLVKEEATVLAVMKQTHIETAKILEDQALTLEQQTKTLEDQFKALRDFDPRTKEGKLKPEFEVDTENAINKAVTNLKDKAEKTLSGIPIKSLTELNVKLNFQTNLEETLKNVKIGIGQLDKNIKLQAKAEGTNKVQGDIINNIKTTEENVQKQITDTNKVMSDSTALFQKSTQDASGTLLGLNEAIVSTSTGLSAFFKGLVGLRSPLADLVPLADEIKQVGLDLKNATPENIDRVNAAYERLIKSIKDLSEIKRPRTTLFEQALGGGPKPDILSTISDPNKLFSAKQALDASLSGFANAASITNLKDARTEAEKLRDAISDIAKKDIKGILQTPIGGGTLQSELINITGKGLQGLGAQTTDAQGKVTQNIDEQTNALKRMKTELDALTQDPAFRAISTQQIGETLGQRLGQIGGEIEKAKGAIQTKTGAEQDRIKLQDFAKDLGISFERVSAKIDLSNAAMGTFSATSQTALPRIIEQTKQIGNEFQRLKDLGIDKGVLSPDVTGQPFFGILKEKIDTTTQSVQQFDSTLQTNMPANIANVNSLTSAYEALNTAIASTPAKGPPPLIAAPHATGGFIRGFATGGFIPRGIDTVPIMASPGEMIINPTASRRFYSQLIAINQNRQPLFQSPSSTTNIGDININVTGQSTAPKTARQIGLELRRELRRGNIR